MKHNGTGRRDGAPPTPTRWLPGRFAKGLLVAMLLACVSLPIGSARAGSAGATTVAMPLALRAGQPTEPAVAAMKEILAYVAKQPGFIDGTLLANSFPGTEPTHLHVTRWQSLRDWEALYNSREFVDLVEKNGRYFEWKQAEIFKPVP